MKILLFILALFAIGAIPAYASQILTVEDVGVSIVVPDDWKHDSTDTFGFLIRPEGEKNKKIRIHLTGHKGISPAEAVQHGLEKVNETREKKNHPPEIILSSEPLTTKSGIMGQKAEVGQQGSNRPSYLTRIYFTKENGRIFCTCIYHYGDMDFSREAEKKIIESLELTK